MISDQDPHYFELLDPDPGGRKLPTKIKTSTEISCLEVLDVLFEGSFQFLVTKTLDPDS
jgi:hypothetical protein